MESDVVNCQKRYHAIPCGGRWLKFEAFLNDTNFGSLKAPRCKPWNTMWYMACSRREPLIYLEAQGQPFIHGKSPFTQPVVEKLDDFQPENKWEMVGQITISIHFKLVVWGSRYFWLMNCMTISLCPTERPGSIWVLPGKDEFTRSGWVFGSCEVVGSGDNWKPGKLLGLLLIF